MIRKLRHEEIPRHDAPTLATLPRHPIVLILENVRSLHNVGSVFRTADAARLQHVYLTGYTGPPTHAEARKTSLGAEETVPYTAMRSTAECIAQLRADGYTIAALEITTTPTPISNLKPTHFPLAVVLGNEVFGVDDATLALCDLALEIPQFGAKHSLNVSVAAGIIAYDVLRQWLSLT